MLTHLPNQAAGVSKGAAPGKATRLGFNDFPLCLDCQYTQ